MARIVIELTNRCNLSCQHCFTGRHGGHDILSLDLLAKIVAEARTNGFDHLSFTGGDPTVHPQFSEVLRLVCEAGYQFSFVTNGWNFVSIYPRILPYREQLSIITFSLDGATEPTHDRLRGKGSYRRVMKAVSVCIAEELPFSFNMVITAHNRHELEPMARQATRLGSRGLRFCHLMPAPLTTLQNADLSPWERKVVEAEVWRLQSEYPIPVAMAPGYHTTSLFPCAPLQMQELNIDCHGNVTKCCHLSGHGEGVGQGDIVGSLKDMSFTDAYQQLIQENERFHAQKLSHLASGTFADSDFFPCWYCSLHYRKVDWLKRFPRHSWSGLIWERSPEEGDQPAPVSDPPETACRIAEGELAVLTMDSRATPQPEVLDTALKSGEIVLLHLGTSQYYTLNETGARIWHLMREGLTLAAICQDLVERFEVTLERAQECVTDLANQLAAENLVQPAH